MKSLVWWKYLDDILKLWLHGNKTCKEFIKILTCCHPNIKFSTEKSKEKVNFWNKTCKIKRHSSILWKNFVSCLQLKFFIPSSKKFALKLNLIRSWFLWKCSNDLDVWLQEGWYSHMLARHQVLKANKLKRAEVT